ncbi:MAG: alpha/beta hydrolase [Gemmatimonadaceae bacterium]|nr:alpha/beta hydrolase [Gemmatimonadaceae bacterium]
MAGAWRGVTIALACLLAEASAHAQPTRLRPRDVDTLPARPATARVPYGSDSLQFGDLRIPEGRGPFPVLVMIHGGCWVHRLANLQNTNALSDALRDAGVATWNVEYRRYDNPGGGWPGTMLDIAAGVDALRALAARYPLDLSRVVVAGHSAGGHLAIWAAARPRLPAGSPLYSPDPLRVHAAIALGGPGDLRDFMTYGQRSCGEGVIDKLLGGTWDAVPERWRQASPAELLPIGVRQRLVVGDADFIMPAHAREAYVARARAAGDSVDLVVVPNAGHFEVIAPVGAAWPRVREAIVDVVRAVR